MRQEKPLSHEFVEYIPDALEEGTLYVSMQFATVSHKCCCGCGNEVVTPLNPTDWKLTFDGKTISLAPSIGNWSFPCQSHYWIEHSRVIWASQWSGEEIVAGRTNDRSKKERYFALATTTPDETSKETPGEVESIKETPEETESIKAAPGRWQRFKRWWSCLIRSNRPGEKK